MIKPEAPKQQFSTNTPRDIVFDRTCRHCGTIYKCGYDDYYQWLNGDLARPWKRERVCSAACYAIVGAMPALNVKMVEVTQVPFHNPDVLVRGLVYLQPEMSHGRVIRKNVI